MTIKKPGKGLTTLISTAMLGLMTCQSAIAAPGALATAPLFLSTIVEPNVFFTLDDSGSMKWVLMVENGTAGEWASSGLPYLDSYRYYYHPDWFSDNTVLPPAAGQSTDWESKLWIYRNNNGNKNYYNPEVTYTPWAGLKADGTPMYLNADPTNAPRHPNSPAGTDTDLTQRFNYYDYDDCNCWRNNSLYLPTYSIWNDTDGDNVIEASDSHTMVEIAAGTDEMQNFANWFVYYRTREFAAKASIGRVINNTDASRMGLDVFNGGHKKNSKSMTDITNKRELLETFYGIPSSGGTPARTSLKRVGELFRSTAATAPIQSSANGGECQQNFNILMTDGFWNALVGPSVGNTDASADNVGYDGNADESNDGGNYEDKYSDTLADVAMHYYETDLRADLANKVAITPGVDEAEHQHLVSYTISFGLSGTLDPIADDPLADGFEWPDAFAGNSQKVDDLWHAAYNGRGKYLSAQNPAELEESLNVSIADIAERTATAAAVSINSAKLTTESVVYLAEFNTNRWQGNIKAFKIVDLATGALAATPTWDAASALNGRDLASSPRVIISHDGSDGVPFQWDNISDAQKDDLRVNPSGGIDTDVMAEARLDYLRGSRADEGAGNDFRERASLLGDMVNSGPVFVGSPGLRWPDVAPFPTDDGSRYTDYKNGNAKTRKGIVYAGANDGKLHGFSEVDGSEVLAYIPGNLFSAATSEGLHYLTNQNYIHKYYNDLTPSISDVYTDLGSGTKWQTILISGQRGGGRGIFALDVTDPNAFSEANAAKIALWEFTNTTDPDLGYTYSQPQIGMMNDGSWVAIFGNGYNDTGDGKAKIFILNISKGVDGTWAAGDYIKITTDSGSAADINGLATPALADIDGNGTIDRAYAGDLKGQMWAFDLSSETASDWELQGGAGSSPLFVTKGAEPITAKATLATHPTVSSVPANEPNLMVYFGSGQYLVDADKTNMDTNYFYGVWDKGDVNLDSTDLVEQTFDPAFAERVLSENAVDYPGNDYGWFFELPDAGERSVTRPVVRGEVVFFNTFVPNSDPCSVGGYGYRMAVDLVDGSSPDEPVIDANNDGLVDDDDLASSGSSTGVIAGVKQEGFLPEPVFIEDLAYTAETPSAVASLRPPPTGRFSWQELIQ